MSKNSRIPSYRLHRATDQAVVTLPDGLGGRDDVYLGVYDTDESRREYDRIIAEWIANGRRSLKRSAGDGLTINQLLVAYWRHVEEYYRHADGTPTSEQDNIRQALRRVRTLYEHTEAAAFNAVALEAVRNQMIANSLGGIEKNDPVPEKTAGGQDAGGDLPPAGRLAPVQQDRAARTRFVR